MLIEYRVLCFFKQKTAYEMRISDWSSDVCSSDLPEQDQVPPVRAIGQRAEGQAQYRIEDHEAEADQGTDLRVAEREFALDRLDQQADQRPIHERQHVGDRQQRSEEHTSELQSLLRISYAVFCLKKKTMRDHHGSNSYQKH